MKIWIVDAFTKIPYSGNPAAVTLVKEFPPDTLCQKIAAEINLSETAFIKPLKDNHFHIRWFTPVVEVKLCGHATLASAHILFDNTVGLTNEIVFDSLSGVLRVYKTSAGITLDFPLQKTGPALNQAFFQKHFPFEILTVEKAEDDIIVEVANEADLRNLQGITEELKILDCRGIIITSKSKTPYDFISRFFAPRVGVEEDPVTGSAHCKLAHYWQKKLNKTKFLAYQASARGGELTLEIKNHRVHITGNAVTMMSGEWLQN